MQQAIQLRIKAYRQDGNREKLLITLALKKEEGGEKKD